MRVVCAVILHQGRILACQRAAGKREGGRWEFPGGKVEAGEEDGEALVREIDEELAMSVNVEDFVTKVVHGEIELWAYRCRWDGDAQEVREHQEVRWIESEEGAALDWAPADVTVWEEVRRTCFPRA